MTPTIERTDFEAKVRRVEALLRAAGAREVYVFGPAVDEGSREPEDVRYAVRALPPAVYYKTLARLWEAVGYYPTVQMLESDDPYVRFLEQSGGLGNVDELFR